MQINIFFDFFKNTEDARYSAFIDLVGMERLKPIVKRISKAPKWGARLSELEVMDIFIHAFPFLDTDRAISLNHQKHILGFISLLEDIGLFHDKFNYAPQKRYTGHQNIGKRYSNFIYRHSDQEEKSNIVSRYLGLNGLPDPIQWENSKRNAKLSLKYEEAWNLNYANLIHYHATYKTCLIDFRNEKESTLRRWCYRQVNQFNKGNLKDKRMMKLKDMGFFNCYGLQDTFSLAS
jgi:hypothetical protein